MSQVVLDVCYGMAAVKHPYCSAVTKTMDGIDILETFRRKGLFEILPADAVYAMASEFFFGGSGGGIIEQMKECIIPEPLFRPQVNGLKNLQDLILIKKPNEWVLIDNAGEWPIFIDEGERHV